VNGDAGVTERCRWLHLLSGLIGLAKTPARRLPKSGGRRDAKDIYPADGPLLIAMVSSTSNSVADDERNHQGVEKLLAESRAMAGEKGLLHRYIFTNYAYYKETVFEEYRKKRLAKLCETSKSFDPKGVFQNSVPGGFKLHGGSI
jgi:hypothetical protein